MEYEEEGGSFGKWQGGGQEAEVLKRGLSAIAAGRGFVLKAIGNRPRWKPASD